MQRRIEYPISAGYCADWTLKDAIREIIANAIDEGNYTVSYDAANGGMYVRNKGSEILPKHLVLGNSEKSDSQIGQFGEGMKIAALVAARLGKKFFCSTSGFSFKPSIERIDALDSDVLVLHLDETSKSKEETQVFLACSREDYQEGKAQFLQWSNCKPISKTSPNILSPGGKLFVNGLFTMPLNSLYSYNLTSKKFINRDRTVVNLEVARREIEKIIQEEGFQVKEFCKMYLEAVYSKEEVVETGIYLSPSTTLGKETFTKMIQKNFGTDKLAMRDGSQSDNILEDKGYKIIQAPKSYAAAWTINNAGVRNTSEELRSNPQLTNPEQYSLSTKNLTDEEHLNITYALKKVSSVLDGYTPEIRLVSRFDNEERTSESEDSRVYIRRDLATEGGVRLISAILRESVLQYHSLEARTHEFETVLISLLGSLLHERA